MVLHSMTGFGAGSAEATLEDGSTFAVGVELRTVNHRHLQTKLRLPSDLAAFEHGLEAKIRERVGRGSLQASFEVERRGGLPAIEVDHDVVARYIAIQRDLQERFGLAPVGSAPELLSLPGVLVQGSRTAARAAEGGPEEEVLHAALDAALDALEAMRAREGEALVADMRLNMTAIGVLVERIESLAPELVAAHKARLVERVAELSGNAQTTEADLAREIALLSDRLDVSEELSRLKSHLDQLKELLAGSGAMGRKLDFLAQEFFREANTIGSKANDANVAHLVVDLKTHVERLREQVQNVE